MEQHEKDFYQTNLDAYKPGTAQRFGWTSSENQEVRFVQLIKLIKLGCKFANIPPRLVTIMDFGCGDGSLFFLMHKLGIGSRYYGIDAMEQSIDDAHARLKQTPIPAKFYEYDWDGVAPLPLESGVDFIVESGAFGTTPAKRRDFLLPLLMFLPRIGFCGTFLTRSREMKYVHPTINLIEPADVLKHIDSDKYKYVLWADYFPYDFAVGAFKRRKILVDIFDEEE
jgi:SAM-dependent methyltransferase